MWDSEYISWTVIQRSYWSPTLPYDAKGIKHPYWPLKRNDRPAWKGRVPEEYLVEPDSLPQRLGGLVTQISAQRYFWCLNLGLGLNDLWISEPTMSCGMTVSWWLRDVNVKDILPCAKCRAWNKRPILYRVGNMVLRKFLLSVYNDDIFKSAGRKELFWTRITLSESDSWLISRDGILKAGPL